MEIDNVMLIITIMLIIAAIVIVIILWNPIFDNKQKYGTWQASLPTECVMRTSSCEGGGTRTITETCMVTSRGIGCLNNQGKQIYGTRTVVQECQPVCQASVFEIIDTGVCTLDVSGCVASGTTGTKTITSKCVAGDSVGVNMCNRTEIVAVTGPTGELGFADRLITYQLGDTITEIVNCTDYPNPICGNWVFVEPAPINFSVCQANSTIFLQENCELGDTIPSISSTLIEGYTVEALDCSTGSTDEVTPMTNCLQLVPPECNNVEIDPSTVALDTFNLQLLGIQCSGINSSLTKPGCLTLCRKQNSDPDIFSSISGFKELLASLLLIRVPGRGYLNVQQSPPVDQLTVVHRDTIPFPTIDGNISPLQLIDLDATDGRVCALEERQFATSSLMRLAYRSTVSANTVLCQAAITQNSDYVGWMTVESTSPSTPKWIKMQTEYNKEGILAKDAPEFQITIDSPFVSEKLPGFPANMLGTARISLKTATGGNLIVPLIDINRTGDVIIGNFSLNNVEVLIFPLDTDLSSRTDRDAGNCNLQYDPNGFLFEPLGEWEF